MAGSTQVIELHGNIFYTKCSRENRLISEEFQTAATPPRCPHCGAYLRPDVVWYGENLPEDELDRTLQAATTCQAFISIGTSTLVEPAASLPFIALRNGATVLEINPLTTPLTPVASCSVQGNAGDVLPILAAQVINS